VIPKYILTYAQDIAKTFPPHVSRIELRYNDHGDIMMIISTTDVSFQPELGLHSVYLYHPHTHQLRHISGALSLDVSMDVADETFRFAVGPTSFFQVHTAMASMLYGYLHEHAPMQGHILDLYSGTGTIGIILAKLGADRTVTSIEIEPDMTALAQHNATYHHVENITIQTGDVRTETFDSTPDCIIVDPPRTGLSKPSLEHLLSLESPQLLYVSCSPHSLLRDLTLILPAYRVTALQLFDMMPYTSHVETVVVLTKK
jgi:tRNA/tmRNA/rRNA uracil-C5-methylase (TrmA/RlmC/RlmD family)